MSARRILGPVQAPRGAQPPGPNGRGRSDARRVLHSIDITLSACLPSFAARKAKRVSGDSSEVGPPVPIPNTVVKGLSADDTRGTSPRDNRPLPEALFAF